MEFDILIPAQHKEVALQILDYVHGRFECAFPTGRKISKEIVRGKYWEAYNCQDETRYEYWRIVLMCYDDIHQFNQ